MKTPTPHGARRTGSAVTLAGALSISALLTCAVANAGAAHPGNPPVKVGVQSAPAMKLKTSPDEKINATGTQGVVRTSAVQGSVQSALQCNSTSSIVKVACDTVSEKATPQVVGK